MFSPAIGDTSTGGHGPDNNVTGGFPCQPYMSDNYHIHVFVGLYVNGQEYAIPTGTGVVEPNIDSNGDSPSGTQCFYYSHTHDSTGVVHIEDPNGNVPDVPPMDSKYVLGQWFQVWGITVSNSQFGPFSGPVEVLTSGQQYRGGGPDTDVPENTLTVWNGDPNQIPLYSHEVIWFLVGPNYPASLPAVHFAEQY